MNSGSEWQLFDPLDEPTNGAVPFVSDDDVLANGVAYADLDGDGLVDVIKDASAIQFSAAQHQDLPTVSTAWLNSYQQPAITQFPNQLAASSNVAYVGIATLAAQTGSAPTYTESGMLDPGTIYAPTPMRVVQSVSKDTGVGSTATTTYQYSDIRGSASGRGLQGFKTMTVTDPSGMVTKTTFSQQYPFTGQTTLVERSNGLGKISRTSTSYCIDEFFENCDSLVQPLAPRTSYFVRALAVSDVSYQPTEVDTTTTFQHDGAGNPTVTIVLVSTPGSSAATGTGQVFQTTTQNQYGTAGSAEELMGKPTQTQVTYHRSAPAPTSQRVHTTQFVYEPVFGALALRTKLTEPGGGDGIELHTAYDYDKFGNVVTTTDCAGDFSNCLPGASGDPNVRRTSRVSFSTSVFNAPVGSGLISSLSYGDGRFPVMATDALNHTSFFAYDPLLGVVLQTTDQNGVHSCQTYDSFGNQTSATGRCGSGDPITTIMNRYEVSDASMPLAKVVTVVLAPTGGGTWTYGDALGRNVATRARHFSGGLTESSTTFDLLGRVATQVKPHLLGDASFSTSMLYDGLSRVTFVSDPLGPLDSLGASGISATTTDYSGGLAISTKVSVGGVDQIRTELKNVVGKVVGVTDAGGTTTNYDYDADGNLTGACLNSQTSDHCLGAQYLTQNGYDTRGRKTASVDADLGTWTYVYDAFGDLVKQTDAKGQISGLSTAMTYDALGRMIGKTDADGGTSQWIYDVAPGAGIGKLAAEIGPENVKLNGACALPALATVTGEDRPIRTYGYTVFGETAIAVDCVDGDIFTTSYQYDAFGRQSQVRYPAVGSSQLAVGYHYSSLGFLQYLTDDSTDFSVLWQANAMDALGKVVDEQTRNGVQTVSARNPTTGWLLGSISTAHSDGNNVIQSMTFGYDEAGNLRSRGRADQLVDAPSSELFTYDRLNRLQTSAVSVGATSSAPAADFSDNYAEDALGNLTLKGGNTYDYGTGCLAGGRIAGPHAVCSVGSGPVFSCDENGNLTRSGARTVSYNATNKPSEIVSAPIPSQGNDTGDVVFVYGADGNRVLQIATSGTTTARTVYVGLDGTGKSTYERTTTTTTSGSTVDNIDFIYAGGAHGGNAFAVLEMAGDGTVTSHRYFNFDHLGSTSTVSDEKGHVGNTSGPDAGVLSYDPWGARRAPDGSPANPASFNLQVGHREFTGHETIPDVGLVNMNGRVYDAVIGRFLSPDSGVQAPNDLQDYNRYSYVLNNPLSFTDPTGYDVFGLSGLSWANIGIAFAGLAICATGPAGCGLVVALTTTAVNATAAAATGASLSQVAGSVIMSAFVGLFSGGVGGAATDVLAGPGIAPSIGEKVFGGTLSGLIGGALAGVASGGHNLGQNILVGATLGAYTSSVAIGIQNTIAVSQASAAQGDETSGESDLEKRVGRQTGPRGGYSSGPSVDAPVTHGPFNEPYDDMQTAAAAAEEAYNPLSEAREREFAGLLYQLDDEHYATPGVADQMAESDPAKAVAFLPHGAVVEGYWHTHGGYDPVLDETRLSGGTEDANELFSRSDLKYQLPSYINGSILRGYVGTPAGMMYEFTAAPGLGPDNVVPTQIGGYGWLGGYGFTHH